MLLFYHQHLGLVFPMLQVDHRNPECPENVTHYFNTNEALSLLLTLLNNSIWLKKNTIH